MSSRWESDLASSYRYWVLRYFYEICILVLGIGNFIWVICSGYWGSIDIGPMGGIGGLEYCYWGIGVFCFDVGGILFCHD